MVRSARLVVGSVGSLRFGSALSARLGLVGSGSVGSVRLVFGSVQLARLGPLILFGSVGRFGRFGLLWSVGLAWFDRAFSDTASPLQLTCMFKTMREEWGDAAFVDYFGQEYFVPKATQGLQMITARWFSGLYAGLRHGHAASQNLVESFNAAIRRVSKHVHFHQGVLELLERLERRFNIWVRTPGQVFSVCGNAASQRPGAPPPDDVSEDFLYGLGRRTQTGGKVLHMPTAEHIVRDYEATKGASVCSEVHGSSTFYVLRRCVGASPAPVDPDDFVVIMRCAHCSNRVEGTVAMVNALREIWRSTAIIDDTGKIDWERITRIYRHWTVVRCRDGADGRVWRCYCECFSKEACCPHILGILRIEGVAAKHYTKTEPPVSPGGRSGTPRKHKISTHARETQEAANKRLDEATEKQQKRKHTGDVIPLGGGGSNAGDAGGAGSRQVMSALEVALNTALAPHMRHIDLSTPKDGHCLFHALTDGGLVDEIGHKSLTIAELRLLAFSLG